MPVVEISVVRGRSKEQIEALADAAHAALVATYGIPAADRFQMIRQFEPHEFIFDRTFAGGPRTDEFVFIRVTAGRPRPLQVKRDLYRAFVEELERRSGIDPENVMVMLDNVDMSDLSLGGGRPFDLHAPHVPPAAE